MLWVTGQTRTVDIKGSGNLRGIWAGLICESGSH